MNWFIRRSGPSLDDFMKYKDGKIPFETTGELLNFPAIKDRKNKSNFSHFAISGNRLMEVSNDGFEWWVIGYVGNPELLDLPKWDGGKYKVQFDDGTIEVLSSKDISYSCLRVVRLNDGRRGTILE